MLGKMAAAHVWEKDFLFIVAFRQRLDPIWLNGVPQGSILVSFMCCVLRGKLLLKIVLLLSAKAFPTHHRLLVKGTSERKNGAKKNAQWSTKHAYIVGLVA